jgi:hypothetical protein
LRCSYSVASVSWNSLYDVCLVQHLKTPAKVMPMI